MAKILLKSAVLFFIVLSIYLIVNPSACSNMVSGRERSMSSSEQNTAGQPMTEQTDSLSAGQQTEGEYTPSLEGIFDTNTLNEDSFQPVYSQQDIDYAIASRYVELEREYAKNTPVGKDSSKEIAFIVMDDFEMSPTEWEDFLTRATATDLFNQIRREMPLQPQSAQ